MPRDVPDWVFPGTNVDDGTGTWAWTIQSLTLDPEGQVQATLTSQEEDTEAQVISVEDLVEGYAARTTGSVSVPFETTDVMVVPVDWSSPPQRWRVQAIVVEDGVRMILEEPQAAEALAEQGSDEVVNVLPPIQGGVRASAYQRLRD